MSKNFLFDISNKVEEKLINIQNDMVQEWTHRKLMQEIAMLLYEFYNINNASLSTFITPSTPYIDEDSLNSMAINYNSTWVPYTFDNVLQFIGSDFFPKSKFFIMIGGLNYEPRLIAKLKNGLIISIEPDGPINKYNKNDKIYILENNDKKQFKVHPKPNSSYPSAHTTKQDLRPHKQKNYKSNSSYPSAHTTKQDLRPHKQKKKREMEQKKKREMEQKKKREMEQKKKREMEQKKKREMEELMSEQQLKQINNEEKRLTTILLKDRKKLTSEKIKEIKRRLKQVTVLIINQRKKRKDMGLSENVI
jgi:hypothetical protein